MVKITTAWLRDKLRDKKVLILLAALVLALVMLGLSYGRFESPSEQASEVITYSTDTPDETKPDEDSHKWRGRPEDPKYITLPTIGAEGYIQNVGVDQNKEVAVPTNIHFAGWFVDSVRPGEKGLSIIDGHLDGRETGGIFRSLASIKQGDTFTVEFGDSSTKRFKVTDVVTVDAKDAASILFSQNPKATNQLNLITCGGNFDPNSRLYDKRVIAVSELIE